MVTPTPIRSTCCVRTSVIQDRQLGEPVNLSPGTCNAWPDCLPEQLGPTSQERVTSQGWHALTSRGSPGGDRARPYPPTSDETSAGVRAHPIFRKLSKVDRVGHPSLYSLHDLGVLDRVWVVSICEVAARVRRRSATTGRGGDPPTCRSSKASRTKIDSVSMTSPSTRPGTPMTSLTLRTS